MKYGNYIGNDFYILAILVISIIIFSIVLLLYIQRKNRSFERNIKTLKESSVIEELEVSDPVLISLVDRYVKGEIDSNDFFIVLKQVKK